MKPGTLFALNQNLCVRQTAESRYRVVPVFTALRPGRDALPEPGPVVPVLTPNQTAETAPRHGWVGRLKQASLYAGMAAALIAANACVFGFEEVSRARERHQLGRAITARERATHQLLLVNRQLAGALAIQAAASKTVVAPAAQFASVRSPAVPAPANRAVAARQIPPSLQQVAMRSLGQTDPSGRLVVPLPTAHLTSATRPERAGDPQT